MRLGKRDTHFYFRFNVGAEVAAKKTIAVDKKMPNWYQIAFIVQTRVLIDWTADDQANDRGGTTCKLSLKKIAEMDEA